MVGGSQASVYYGEPRLTRDVDVVAALRPQHVPAFVRGFPPAEFYIEPEAVSEAIASAGQFNIVHPGSGLKVDVYVNPDTPYDRERLARRQKLPIAAGVDAYFARPEDVILYKLLYYRQGRSTVHLRDIDGILRVSGAELDHEYLSAWLERLGLTGIWDEFRRQRNP